MHLQKAVKVTKRAVVFLFVTMFILAFTACDYSEDVTVSIALMNTSKESYNLWIGHTDNLTAQSLVPAGGVGTWTATMTAKGPNSDTKELKELIDSVTVNAGMDGKKISTQKLSVRVPYAPGMTLSIRWDGRSFSVAE